MKNLYQNNRMKQLFSGIHQKAKKTFLTKIQKQNFTNVKNRVGQNLESDFMNSFNRSNKDDNFLYKNILKLCQTNNYNNNLIKFNSDLEKLGLEQGIPAFAYVILIDQNLQEKKYYESMNILIDSFLNNKCLDIPVFEDVLMHFVANDYSEGIPLVLDLYRYSFVIPSMNILVIAKEASERKLIEQSKYQEILKNFQSRDIDFTQDSDNIEEFISMKQKRMNKIFLEKSSKFFKIQSISDSKMNQNKESDFESFFYDSFDQENSPYLNLDNINSNFIKKIKIT